MNSGKKSEDEDTYLISVRLDSLRKHIRPRIDQRSLKSGLDNWRGRHGRGQKQEDSEQDKAASRDADADVCNCEG